MALLDPIVGLLSGLLGTVLGILNPVLELVFGLLGSLLGGL